MNNNFFEIRNKFVIDYDNCCVRWFDEDKFSRITSSDVALEYQSDDGTFFVAQGRKDVSELIKCQNKVHIGHIKIRKGTLFSQGDEIILELEIKEEIKDGDKIKSCKFKNRSVFQFEDEGKVKGLCQINRIKTVVERIPNSPRKVPASIPGASLSTLLY